MQPNALLIRQNFIVVKSGCYSGKLITQTNPLKEVHIVEMSVSKLSIVEGLVLPHLLSGVDGGVIIVRSFWNIIMCKITVQPYGPVW
jgi:hypothetical protein